MGYSVKIISMDERDAMAERYAADVSHEVKSDIYGCCIKLLTGSAEVRDRWMENFYFISSSIRSHARLYVVSDPDLGADEISYCPHSKTVFLVNVGYYGWIKSLALSAAGDVLEDHHGIYSVHGACLDLLGRGICLLGGSGAGKTTHTYGFLRRPETRAVSDDWFFARIYGCDVLAYGSEKNFYIRAELSEIWKEFSGLVEKAEFDDEGRGVVDLRFAIGKGRILPLTTLAGVVILKRDPDDEAVKRRLSPEEALAILEENGYYNPHLLVKSGRKRRLRSGFFGSLFDRVPVYLVNTVRTPEESQRTIQDAISEGLRTR
ncbi:HPr kinase/phosphorylase [Candidatus Methanocrinis natronophilus]|uniref:Aldolase n=1 Tax=Candidatus Methanocrinis natronophilus TaxID=3033396 RepID=A0ABT5X7X1_9EURY|nr:aldolase [Candidatus Methanocrinis natronophilus]MDF0590789.1 aldolase [Candidatus Methanocrinis natronophilus]